MRSENPSADFVAQFRFYDISDFPTVRIQGSRLPAGYAPEWIAEMDTLLGLGKPFALIFLDSAENPTHQDQKTQAKWMKKHRKPLAVLCRGAVSVEPDRAKRLLKRAQALAITAAMGLRFSIAPDREEAEMRARRLLAGETLPDDEE